jgi:carboxyl-terminal processing protease
MPALVVGMIDPRKDPGMPTPSVGMAPFAIQEPFMPRRNFAIIALMLVFALICYSKVRTNPYNRVLAESMYLVENKALEDVNQKQLFQGAMEGMLVSLDDTYSYYLPPAAQKELNEELDSKFGGIGVKLDTKARDLTVLAPIFNSPAYKAGVRSGDKILRINNQSTQGMSRADASDLLRGQPGDKVVLTVLHQGEEKPIDLDIIRAEIHIDTVLGDTPDGKGSWNYFLPGADKIAYLRVTSFSEDTAAELRRVLKSLTEQEMKGVIVDLRQNPGGLLPSACEISNLFLKVGEMIVSTRGRDEQIRREYKALVKGPYTDVPMVVLVDGKSASASEIVAACLQDNHRAAIVGQRSFGKGTVQDIIELEKDCGAIRLTTCGYWRPSGKNIHRKHGASENDQWGVQPDPGCKVVLTGDELTKWFHWRMKRDEQQPTDASPAADDYRTADRQLEKAVEVLQKAIAK